MKDNKEKIIRVYDDNGKNVQDVILEAFEKFLKSIGMPSTFAEIGAKKEDIELLTDKLLGNRKTEGNYVKLTREDVIKIYESAL